MNKKMQLTGVALMLSVLVAMPQGAMAREGVNPAGNTANPSVAAIGNRIWKNKAALKTMIIAVPGPAADPYLQHKPAAKAGNDAHVAAIGHNIWSNPAVLRKISIAAPGPEADPYLQHQRGEK